MHPCIPSHPITSDPVYFQHHFLSGGRRGNIVQVYPSVEYDFVPSELSVEQGTLLHFQWTGSDANPNGNAGGSQWGPVLKSTKTAVRFGDWLNTMIWSYVKGCPEKTHAFLQIWIDYFYFNDLFFWGQLFLGAIPYLEARHVDVEWILHVGFWRSCKDRGKLANITPPCGRGGRLVVAILETKMTDDSSETSQVTAGRVQTAQIWFNCKTATRRCHCQWTSTWDQTLGEF